jgi:sugar-specific transcriptional regulator TrmB
MYNLGGALFLELDNDSISTLIRLGFSSNQAKVYLALVMVGSSSAKNIWQSSGVAREEVYRKLCELQKRGFVEKMFAKPAMFRATPLECVIIEMLHSKAEKIFEVSKGTEELLKKVHAHKRENLQAETPDTVLIPRQKPLLERSKKELEGLKVGLDTICSWKKGIGWMSSHYDLFMNALNRNVKVRFLIEKSEDSRFPTFVEKLKKNPLFQIKTVQNLPPACIGLYDQKILLIDTSAKTGFIESPVLLTTNPSIVGMAQIYFDKMWTNSLNT